MMGDASLFGDLGQKFGLIVEGKARVGLYRLQHPMKRRTCEGCGQYMDDGKCEHSAEFKIGKKGETWQLFLCAKCAKDMEREIRKCEPEEEEER